MNYARYSSSLDGRLAAQAEALLVGGWAIREGMAELGLEVRAGLHAGECELLEEKVRGIAVHIGARVASQAQPGEVFVSSTVKDLVAGSGIEFEDRGVVRSKACPNNGGCMR